MFLVILRERKLKKNSGTHLVPTGQPLSSLLSPPPHRRTPPRLAACLRGNAPPCHARAQYGRRLIVALSLCFVFRPPSASPRRPAVPPPNQVNQAHHPTRLALLSLSEGTPPPVPLRVARNRWPIFDEPLPTRTNAVAKFTFSSEPRRAILVSTCAWLTGAPLWPLCALLPPTTSPEIHFSSLPLFRPPHRWQRTPWHASPSITDHLRASRTEFDFLRRPLATAEAPPSPFLAADQLPVSSAPPQPHHRVCLVALVKKVSTHTCFVTDCGAPAKRWLGTGDSGPSADRIPCAQNSVSLCIAAAWLAGLNLKI